MDKLKKEINKFLGGCNLQRLNQKEIENMSRPITSMEIERVIKKLSRNQSPGPDGFTDKYYQTSSGELSHTLLNLFQKIAEEETLPNSFCEATITLISKPDKDITQKRKLQANISDEHRHKNPQQKCYQTKSNNTLKSSYTMIKLGLFQGCKDSSIYSNQSM